MQTLQRYTFPVVFLLMAFLAACAPVKTLDTWQDQAYNQPIKKVLVIAVAQSGIIRNQFENVLSNQLAKRGVEAIPSYKVLPQSTAQLDRETVVAKVKELGVGHVLVARSIKKSEITNYQQGGMFFAASAIYSDGWYTYYTGSMVYPMKEYDTDYFTVATNLFALGSKQPVWSMLSQIKVEGSRQGAVNDFVPVIVKQLEESQLLK
jgi:hypothetical protein